MFLWKAVQRAREEQVASAFMASTYGHRYVGTACRFSVQIPVWAYVYSMHRPDGYVYVGLCMYQAGRYKGLYVEHSILQRSPAGTGTGSEKKSFACARSIPQFRVYVARRRRRRGGAHKRKMNYRRTGCRASSADDRNRRMADACSLTGWLTTAEEEGGRKC